MYTLREMEFFIDGREIENVDEICYLGNILDGNGKVEDDVSNKINQARISYNVEMLRIFKFINREDI